MKLNHTHLDGCFILEPEVYTDERGLFMETYNKRVFEDLSGLHLEFVQENQSVSQKNVLRGLHFQIGEHAQAKLVRVVQGAVLDVCVDLRTSSSTFGQHLIVELSSANQKQVFIPRGFAHGFYTLEDNTVFSYKCDNFYHKASERGIIYNDPDLAIDWNLNQTPILSDKDRALPTLKAFIDG